MTRPARLTLFLLVGLAISYGMLKAGVPMWLRMAVTFGMGYTCAPVFFRDKGEEE